MPQPLARRMTKRALRRAVTEFRRDTLAGDPPDRMCFMVVAPLQGFLSILGVETDFVEVDFPTTSHCWLALPDGTIIDPTASQFSTPTCRLPTVYIGPVPEQYQAWIAEAESEQVR